LLKNYIGRESHSLRDDPSYTLMFILHAVSKPSVDYFMRVNGGQNQTSECNMAQWK
jgi:hypothetical protein